MPAVVQPGFYDDDAQAREAGSSLFKFLDLDQSGSLSRVEVLKARTFMLGKGECQGITISADNDANNDGVVDESEWHEFLASLYEVIGKTKFLALMRDWAADASEDSDAAVPIGKAPSGKPAAKASSAKSKAKAKGKASQESGSAKRGSAKDEATPVVADGDDEEKQQAAAALKIQKMHRGKAARKAVADKKVQKDAAPKSRDAKFTTLGDLWELLVLDNGPLVSCIQGSDLVNLFHEACRNGLDWKLAAYVPMHFDNKVDPEDLSAGEVAHLCTMVIKGEVTEDDARKAIGPIKKACREKPYERASYGHLTCDLNFRRFKQLLQLISVIMRIDLELIVVLMQWPYTNVFELTDFMTAVVIERCSVPPVADIAGYAALGPVTTGPDMRVLTTKFQLEDFTRFMYTCDLVCTHGRKGIVYGDVGIIYRRTLRDLPKRLKERADARKQKITARLEAAAADSALIGRTEFEVLMEELHKAPQISKLYTTPMHFLVGCLERTTHLDRTALLVQ